MTLFITIERKKKINIVNYYWGQYLCIIFFFLPVNCQAYSMLKECLLAGNCPLLWHVKTVSRWNTSL